MSTAKTAKPIEMLFAAWHVDSGESKKPCVGREARITGFELPKGVDAEARRARAGLGVLEKGTLQPSLYQISGERCKLQVF